MGVRMEGRYEKGQWVIGAGPKGPVDYDRHLPDNMGGDPWHPDAWRPATKAPPPPTTPFAPGRSCKWKVCDYRLIPNPAAVASWVGSSLFQTLTASAGYLLGSNDTLELPDATVHGPHNVTAAIPPAANPNTYGPLVFLPPLVLAGGYGAYRLHNYCRGQPNTARQPGVPRAPEAVPLQAV
jgi:hypothetical protein